MDKTIPQPVVKPRPQPRKSASSVASSLSRSAGKDSSSSSLSEAANEDTLAYENGEINQDPPQLPPRAPTCRSTNIPSCEVILQDTIINDYRDFAIKAGYTLEEFTEAVIEIGKNLKEVDNGQLLDQLKAVHDKRLSRSVSKDSDSTSLSDAIVDLVLSDCEDTTNTPPQLPSRPHAVKPRLNAEPRNTSRDDLREFALRKGFTETEFRSALVSIGKRLEDIDNDTLLAQLLAVTQPSAPKLPPRPNSNNNSAELRTIVIDGSNIAMT